MWESPCMQMKRRLELEKFRMFMKCRCGARVDVNLIDDDQRFIISDIWRHYSVTSAGLSRFFYPTNDAWVMERFIADKTSHASLALNPSARFITAANLWLISLIKFHRLIFRLFTIKRRKLNK